MKILFVCSTSEWVPKTGVSKKPIYGQDRIHYGLSLVMGMLLKHGHECDVVVFNQKDEIDFSILKDTIETFNPEIVGFTAVFVEFEFICGIAEWVKKHYPNLFLIAGGVHITLTPDESYLSLFDAICIGEGEYPMLELVENLEQQKPINNIQNLWVKTPSGIEKNPTRPFVNNLDELEVDFSYRDMWQRWITEPLMRPTVLLGRGCPYKCTYCSNHKLRKVSPGKYVRRRSPEYILEEIWNLYKTLPGITEIHLEVETILVDKIWFKKLCDSLEIFSKETNFKIKFRANLRVYPNMDVEFVFAQLKRAGITWITVGLESGSYRIRKEILNRDYSNELILKVAEVAKAYNMDIGLFSMVGLPTETPVEFAETIKMNRLIRPKYLLKSIFFPYPGTELSEMCKEMNLLPQKISVKKERELAVLDLPGFSKRQIQRSFDFFDENVYQKWKKSPWLTFTHYLRRFLGYKFYFYLKDMLIIQIFYKQIFHRIKGSRTFKKISIFYRQNFS